MSFDHKIMSYDDTPLHSPVINKSSNQSINQSVGFHGSNIIIRGCSGMGGHVGVVVEFVTCNQTVTGSNLTLTTV